MLTKACMAITPSSSVFDRLIAAFPSDPTTIDFPVHWPLIKSPEMMSQYVPAGKHVY